MRSGGIAGDHGRPPVRPGMARAEDSLGRWQTGACGEPAELTLLADTRGQDLPRVFGAFRALTRRIEPAGALQLQALERRVCLLARALISEPASPPALLYAVVAGLRDGLRASTGRTEDPVLDKVFRKAIDKAVAACEAEVCEAVLVAVKAEVLRPGYPDGAGLRRAGRTACPVRPT